jgi:hypothetical protein
MGRGGPDGDALAAALRAVREARDAGDASRMTEAALALPAGQRFGTHPGAVPALLHEAYAAAAGPDPRSRLAAALARAWVYGGDSRQAARFADEALRLAEQAADDAILANALDAALLARWGPDDFAPRRALAARLADAAAHLTDPGARLTAHLWQLTTAWERLDLVSVQRQLRGLDLLADETGSSRDAFFATSRRAMHALVTGELSDADRLITATGQIGDACGEPDVEAVCHSLAASRARRAGDAAALRREAAAFQEYGTREGVPSVSAEAAVLWLEGGEPGRALELLNQVAGTGLDSVTRDVDFLLTTASLVAAGAELGRDDIAADGIRLLEPYAGRAVLNAGAVTFHGVVEEYLFRAGQAVGHTGAASWREAAASCYRRICARWWQVRLGEPRALAPAPVTTMHLHPGEGTGWLVGRAGAAVELPALRGLTYLRYLLQRPGADVSSLELAAAAAGHAGEVAAEPSSGELTDARALAEYRQRLRDIDSELTEAQSWSDEGRLTRLRLEREALLHEVRAATALAGRARRFSSAGERARVAVRKAISAALARMAEHDPPLGRLLGDTVHTGAVCRYDPDPARPVHWLLDPPPAASDGDPGRPG